MFNVPILQFSEAGIPTTEVSHLQWLLKGVPIPQKVRFANPCIMQLQSGYVSKPTAPLFI
jgi:hypothetical protein